MRRGLLLAVTAAAIVGGASASRAATSSVIVFSADRAPSLSGEIYRADPSGRVVDLSNSPYRDVNPVVSPDGKRVAFLSDRSGAEGIYEVGIDGRGLVRVAPSIDVTCDFTFGGDDCPPLAWQPHGGRLAIGWSGRGRGGAWIVQRGNAAPVRLGFASGIDGWSPDGRELLTLVSPRGSNLQNAVAVSPRGRSLWRIRNVSEMPPAWSLHGLLAVDVGGNAPGARQAIAVYDEAGRLRFSVRVGSPKLFPSATWSPDGRLLAIAWGKTLEVRTAAGLILLRKKVSDVLAWGDVVWAGNERLALALGTDVRILDLRTGKLGPASKRFLHRTSPDGKLATLETPSGDGFALQVAPTAGGPAKAYTHVPGCDQGLGWSADVGQVAFVPHSRSLVYASICSSAFPGLYSVPATGGTPHPITQAPREPHASPALSPDGSEIAYSTQCDEHLCDGPAATIDVASMDGAERTVTAGDKCVTDQSPAWSPDGTTILFARWQNCGGGQPELYTVAASGDSPTVHDLGISGTQPAWGPSRIAYVSMGVGSAGIWTANPDGSDPVQVDAGVSDFSPAWSPSGQLAYLKGTNGTTLVVGSTQAQLPFARVTSLAWSPDGTRLVVTAAETAVSPLDVYTIDQDGTDPVQLTTNYDALDVAG